MLIQGIWGVQVPSCNSKGGYKEVCKFGTTSRGDYICAGNSIGDVRVYDTSSGRQVALVSPIKVTTSGSSLHRVGAQPCVPSLGSADCACIPQASHLLLCSQLMAINVGQISAPVRACGLSEDCRHLVAVLGNGYIFRYEYRKSSSAEEAAVDGSPVEESEDD